MKTANWIISSIDTGDVCPAFRKIFILENRLQRATLEITAMGVYEATLNGQRIGDFILAPGFTSYSTRLQFQCYDITELIAEKNDLTVTVGNGWYCGRLGWENMRNHWGKDRALIAKITLVYENKTSIIYTDSSWDCASSNILFAEIYDGEVYNAAKEINFSHKATILNYDKKNLIEQEGELVCEQDVLKPVCIFTAPNGETVIDFGQNITGYVKFSVTARQNDEIEYSHGEILDKNGNFYNENLRTAKAHIRYICKEGQQEYKPHHTFMGFRYIRLEKSVENILFEAIVVHSNIKRTGYFACGNSKINQLYKNIIWGQKGNFLDIPTDCPQRDERLGWTGDAQAFVRTAAYNFDVHRFFNKWLNDVLADQFDSGSIPHVVPNLFSETDGSAAWGDAAVICPWQIYLTYGDKKLLRRHFDSMKRWVYYSANPNRVHFGDWLAQDKEEYAYQDIQVATAEDSLKGHSNQKLISDAFNLYSTALCIKAGIIINEDIDELKKHYNQKLEYFQNSYTYVTQTECALAVYFDIAKNPQETANQLAMLVKKNGSRLSTGFVGTPYLLHALSKYKHVELAYDLLLCEKHPSWLFSVNRGATTIWEHWDGIREDGSLNDIGMNSYNHYAYGAVADWIYSVSAGIQIDEKKPAFENIILAPTPDKRLGFIQASVDTLYGTVYSAWEYRDDTITYHFSVPNRATVQIGSYKKELGKGVFSFMQTITGEVYAL